MSIFGSVAEKYVKQFQEENHLLVSGKVNLQTWNEMLAEVEKQSKRASHKKERSFEINRQQIK